MGPESCELDASKKPCDRLRADCFSQSFFDIASKWPQEIGRSCAFITLLRYIDFWEVHEKRSLTSVEPSSSTQSTCLEFPSFHLPTLVQSSWEARDATGRINILLSERLVSKTSSPGEVDLGATNDIVCFSFQHGPRGMQWKPYVSL